MKARRCPKCGRLITDLINLEAIEEIGECLYCEHIEGDILSDQRMEGGEENDQEGREEETYLPPLWN